MAVIRLPPGVVRCRRRIRKLHGVILLTALLVVAYGLSAAIFLQRSRDQALRDAAASLENIAQSAEIGVNRSLFEIDALLLGVERVLATVLADKPLDDPSVTTMLRLLNTQNLAVSDILIVDPNGREVNRAVPNSHPSNDSERPFFAVDHAPIRPALFIGAPQPNANGGDWSIMVSRRLIRDGVVVGVVAAEVPTATFADFFKGIATVGGTRVALLLNTGVVVAGEPEYAFRIGRVARFAPVLAAALAQGQQGVAELGAEDGGSPGLIAFHSVTARPLVVSAARDRSQILRSWYMEGVAAACAFAFFAATALILAWLVIRALGRGQLAASHLRRSEAHLRRQRALLQSTLENIGEGLSVFDARGRLIARNTRFCELLDLPADLSARTPLRDILLRQAARGDFGDGDPQTEVARRLDLFYREVPVVKERVSLTGRTLQIRRRAMPDGAVLTVYSDITEIKAGERRILQARAQAEAANRSKSEFLANMSHELRTPLNAIIGFSEIISNELFGSMGNDKYLEYIKDIHSSSLHLLLIINDVLDMSKIEAGKLELAKGPVTIQTVIADVIRMMAEAAQSRGVELRSELAAEDVVLWVDERAMRQIFLNVLSNAAKFSETGGSVVVRLALTQEGLAVFEIADRGIGMNEEEQERALQPFGQAKPATTRNYGGTGLGLPITKGLVEAHGGALTIDSRPGAGTTVRIALPVEQLAAGATNAAMRAAAADG